jgi:glycosyltransferase involved in cell wall biosynthesis
MGRLQHALWASPSYAIKALEEAGIKPDVIHAYFAFDAVYASEISKKLRIPLVATLLGIDVSASNLTLITSGNASWVKLLFYRKSLGKRTAIFQCVSQFLCKSAGHYYPLKKIKKGFLGIDESQFDFSEVTEEKVILHIGRLVEKKGTIYLLKAFELVLKEEPKAKLIIVGDGPLGPELKAWIVSHHLSDSVKMTPKASREEIASLLKKCRLFCLPSVTAANGDTEGLPVAVTEAMAVGRPVISTWHAGIPEAVEDGKSGYLVPERDVDDLAMRIKELLGNLERCRAMGAEGRRAVETRFSLAACAQETERVYSEVLANGISAQNQ